MKGYFVTGTDTGVGKTYVTCLVARRARARGLRVFGFKPIETGCRDRALGNDQTLLVEASGGWQTGRLQGVYRFALPAAPRVAAHAESARIDLDEVLSATHEGAATADLTLVEGAGGWRVPITGQDDMAGLARRLGLPVLVVARAGLGTINHSLLTVQAVEGDGCQVDALILSQRPDDELWLVRSNVEQIESRWPGRVLLCQADGAVLDPLL